VQFGDAACQDCFLAQCSAECETYSTTPGAAEHLTCATQCTDQACMDACDQQHPDAAAPFADMMTCVSNKCETECQLNTGCILQMTDPGAQAALLRALQSQTFYRVGGTSPIHTDVRVVCATHRDLDALGHRGTFRTDLYYRLCGVPLDVPPLRQRGPDVLLLTQHVLDRNALASPNS